MQFSYFQSKKMSQIVKFCKNSDFESRQTGRNAGPYFYLSRSNETQKKLKSRNVILFQYFLNNLLEKNLFIKKIPMTVPVLKEHFAGFSVKRLYNLEKSAIVRSRPKSILFNPSYMERHKSTWIKQFYNQTEGIQNNQHIKDPLAISNSIANPSQPCVSSRFVYFLQSQATKFTMILK